MRRTSKLLFSLAFLASAAPAAFAQQTFVPGSDSLAVAVDSAPEPGVIRSLASKVVAPVRLVRRKFSSNSDRREYEAARAVAERATGYRVVVDIGDHRLWVIDGNDTLRTAPVATAMNTTLTYGGKSWRGAPAHTCRAALPAPSPKAGYLSFDKMETGADRCGGNLSASCHLVLGSV